MNHLMHWKKGGNELFAFGRVIECSCDVRNEVNGRRHAHEVVYSIPDKKPCQPRQFPKGIWIIRKPLERTSKHLAPYFIPCDAYRDLPVWALKDGKYDHPTADTVRDWGYGLHFSTSSTTLGCIKIHSEANLLWLVDQIFEHIARDEIVTLEVT
jgi:hypothetical protein